MAGGQAMDYPEDFAAWWQHYPKRVGKLRAYQEWAKARRADVLPPLEDLIRQTRRYAALMVTTKEDERDRWAYTLHPERWLKYRRWEDELPMTAEEAAKAREQPPLSEEELAARKQAEQLERNEIQRYRERMEERRLARIKGASS